METFIPYIKKDNVQIHLTYEDSFLFHYNIDKSLVGYNFGMSDYKKWTLSYPIAKYILLCDGKNTHHDILTKIGVNSNLIGIELFRGLKNIDILDSSDTQVYSYPIKISGSFESNAPFHIGIELTDFCNFKCKHCYLSCDSREVEVRPLEEVLWAIEKMYENGVRVVELTGGECTTYPKFREVLDYCHERFNLISVVTNGYVLGQNKELCNHISDMKNVMVQVSIDGMEQHHDDFRNKKHAFVNACNAVRYLREKGTLVRVASSIYEGSIDQIDDLYKLCKELNVNSWAVSPVIDAGRGSCLSCSSSQPEILEKIEAKLKPYTDDPLFESNRKSAENSAKAREINCGAGWRSFTLNMLSGEIKLCPFDEFNNTIGNIFKDEYLDIFNYQKVDEFKKAPRPSPYLDTCNDCKYIQECVGCFTKAFKICRDKYPQCPWKSKYLPNFKIN